MSREKRLFRMNPLVLRRLRIQNGLTIEKFCLESKIDKQTYRKMANSAPVSLGAIAKAAAFLGVNDHFELLHPDELFALGTNPPTSDLERSVNEWVVQEYLSPWEKTANGLQFQTAILRHRFRLTRFARGKCYELRHLVVAERQRLAVQLERHVEVCERIGQHPNVAENITATAAHGGGLWWVLDKFEEGPTLADRLRESPIEGNALKAVMAGIGAGLEALHAARVVRRELAPRFVTLRKKDQSPVLTDFELAKLLDGQPTVAPKGGWPDDPFLAAEVAARGTVDERADIYSWGRIFVAAATGAVPAKGVEAGPLSKVPLPESLKSCVLQCVARPRSERPKDMRTVLKLLRRWTPSA
jgi:serine/threonine protein kinase